MSVLEEFWYGNLDPAEYDTSPSEEYKEFLQLISRNEENLLATMTDTRWWGGNSSVPLRSGHGRQAAP